MRIASIDIGTNTVLLLVAEVDDTCKITPLVYEQRIPRLGKGVDASRNLHPDSMMRAIGVLSEYKTIIHRYSIDATIVVGTSAVRDARNRDEFVQLVRNETGFRLEVLSGEDEALWTYRGAINGIPDVEKATVIDIGGGSTEITVGNRRKIHESISLDIGSVRLTERFLRHDPPTRSELETAISFIEDELATVDFDFKDTALVGVAGTSTSLAILAQGLKEFSVKAVTNHVIDFESVDDLFGKLSAMNSATILLLSSIMEGRSDVITAGTLILREIMTHFKFQEMIVSERGVRYGLALREFERRYPSAV